MTYNTRDYLMWKNGKGRYSEGGKHFGSVVPKEGGALSPEYRATNAGYKNAQAMFRNHSGVVVGQSREPLEADAMPYAPPRMERIAGESKDAPEPSTVMDFEPMAEAPENVFTPISCYVEGEPAGSVR